MPKRTTWDNRITRAEELLDRNLSSSEPLAFYERLLALQKEMRQRVGSTPPLTTTEGTSLREQLDLEVPMRWLSALIDIVEKHGPAKLAEEARRVSAAPREEHRQIFVEFLQTDAPTSYLPSSFFARVLLQPYAEFLALRLTVPAQYSRSLCPLCGSRPQFAVLRPEGDGGKRHLACSLCLTEWEFRRIICPVCDEVDPFKLPRYSPEDPIAVRVDACDTCKSYLKSFDMTVNGLLVPEVDEIATVPLDLWASQHGYHKFQLNLLGF